MRRYKEMYNRELEDLKNRMNNTITETKNILEGINNKITESEE